MKIDGESLSRLEWILVGISRCTPDFTPCLSLTTLITLNSRRSLDSDALRAIDEVLYCLRAGMTESKVPDICVCTARSSPGVAVELVSPYKE